MAASSFDAALSRVLAHEGGYSNHPSDPGGPTMRGIIQRVYDADRKSRGLPLRPVRQIAAEEVRAIYRTQYWDAVRADDLPPGLDYVVFDGAVNSGPGQSAKWLQRGLGLAADGQVGAVTLAAAQACPDLGALVEAICDRRLAMLRSLATWPVFGTGWARRVADVRRDGLAWVQAGTADVIGGKAAGKVRAGTAGGDKTGGGKAPAASAPPPVADGVATATAAGGALASAVSEAARQIAPFASGSSTLALLFAGLTVLGVLVTLAGLVLLWRAGQTRAARAAVLDLEADPAVGGPA